MRLEIMSQIAQGMAFISRAVHPVVGSMDTSDTSYVHRDLAARNVLVRFDTEDKHFKFGKFKCKINDFGMTR